MGLENYAMMRHEASTDSTRTGYEDGRYFVPGGVVVLEAPTVSQGRGTHEKKTLSSLGT